MEKFTEISKMLETRMAYVDTQSGKYLRSHCLEYQDKYKQLHEILKNERINSFLIHEGAVSLTAEEHALFMEYLELKSSLEIMEHTAAYLFGVADHQFLLNTLDELLNFES